MLGNKKYFFLMDQYTRKQGMALKAALLASKELVDVRLNIEQHLVMIVSKKGKRRVWELMTLASKIVRMFPITTVKGVDKWFR